MFGLFWPLLVNCEKKIKKMGRPLLLRRNKKVNGLMIVMINETVMKPQASCVLTNKTDK